jgi:CHAD domain-containing protein
MNIHNHAHQEPANPSPDEGPAPGGVGQTLLRHLGRCIERLEDPSLKPAWVVHEVRKDLKRSRALLRLCEEVLPTRRLEKRCADAARRLSPLRDADAASETLARLRPRADDRQRQALEALAAWLARQREAASGAPGLPRPVATGVADSLRKVAGEVRVLPFDSIAPAALDASLVESWSDTADAFRRVVHRPVLPRFHAFRKTVKRELHQRELCGRPLERMERATLKKLAEVLGELQDLDVLRDKLREAGRWRGPVRRLVKQTIRELKTRAIRLGDGRYLDTTS